MSPPNANADSTTDNQSMGMRRGSVTFWMRAAPRMSAPTAMGATSQNIQRQSSTLRMRPEIVGPIAGATDMTMAMLPIVLPREAGGTRVITVVISSGIMMAVPVA